MRDIESEVAELQKRIDFFRDSGRPVPLFLESALIKRRHKIKTGKRKKGKLLPWFARKALIRNPR